MDFPLYVVCVEFKLYDIELQFCCRFCKYDQTVWHCVLLCIKSGFATEMDFVTSVIIIIITIMSV